MCYSRTQHCANCGVQTHYLLVTSPALYWVTVLHMVIGLIIPNNNWCSNHLTICLIQCDTTCKSFGYMKWFGHSFKQVHFCCRFFYVSVVFHQKRHFSYFSSNTFSKILIGSFPSRHFHCLPITCFMDKWQNKWSGGKKFFGLHRSNLVLISYPSNYSINIWAVTCDFQQCGILTCVDSDEPLQPHFKLRNSKRCSVSRVTVIEYSSD